MGLMRSEEVRRRFVSYFEGLGHLHLPGSSLVVQGDPSVLLNSAGMQQFKPFYLDPSRAPARRVVTFQRCLRTTDIDEVNGGRRHPPHPLRDAGQFRLRGHLRGGYFKPEAIAYGYEFVTRHLRSAPTGCGPLPGRERHRAAPGRVGGPVARHRRAPRAHPAPQQEAGWRPGELLGPHRGQRPAAPAPRSTSTSWGAAPRGDRRGVWPGARLRAHRGDLEPGLQPVLPGAGRHPAPLSHTGVDTGAGFERIVSYLQGSLPRTRATSYARWCRPRRRCSMLPTGRTSRSPAACASSPTTPAP